MNFDQAPTWVSYNESLVTVNEQGNNPVISNRKYEISVIEKPKNKKLGVLIVGLGGNNGSTLVASLIAYNKGIVWNTKTGPHEVKFLGSLSQYGSVHIGYDKNMKPHSRLFSEMGNMYKPSELVVHGWDICSDNLYQCCKKAQVIEPALLDQIEDDLTRIKPMYSFYRGDFISSNQRERMNNVYPVCTSVKSAIEFISRDIKNFRFEYDLDQVVVVWSGSTERMSKIDWNTEEEMMRDIDSDNTEISPSMVFALASIMTGAIFINGSPQNTLNRAILDLARKHNTFACAGDLRSGQTRNKAVLVDFLTSCGIKPLSIVSYNHLGNNDGYNLSDEPQFKSKEITKKSVIDDVVEANPQLFINGTAPDHTVVIKYVPAVGDSKRAMDEYYSELMLDGRHTMAIHNTCEDSLLAVPVILDLIIFSEFFSRVRILPSYNNNITTFHPSMSFLSFFFKSPVVNDHEPLINSFFKQRHGLENFFRILNGLPPLDHVGLSWRI